MTDTAALKSSGSLAGQPVAETTNGKVRGIVDGGVRVFKGIRYAATTAGANRFLPPQPAEKWSGIRDALHWGPTAPQAKSAEHANPFYSWYFSSEPMGEDCLFLNVFTPGLDSGKRPVMVWLHGGGWRASASSAPGWDSASLSRAQDVVLVTVNHRLNGFGFLSLEGSGQRFADSGNAGLLDMVTALQWVRDNAAAFGGDPNNVTIFGQSGGAAKVAALLAMPAAKGLFHKAIVQSTSGGMRIAGREEAERMAGELAAVLGTTRLSGEELQKLSTEQLAAALAKTPGPFRPVLDNRNFHADPYYPAAPGTSAGVTVMAGTAHTESTWYYAAHPNNFSLEFVDVKRRLLRLLKIDGAGVDAVIDAYRAEYPQGNPTDIITAITTDYLYRRNTLRIASLQAASSARPVYVYEFARSTPIGNGRYRSPHASELPFIFGTTDAAEAMCGKGGDIEAVTSIMMATWAAFARTGNPSNPAIPEWKAFNEPDRWTMMLSADSRVVSNPGAASRAALEVLPYYEYSNDRSSFVKD